MFFPSRETILELRKTYPAGMRVELVQMDDFQTPPPGTQGTVRGVDDAGNILMRWDTGSSLSVAYGVDTIRVIK